MAEGKTTKEFKKEIVYIEVEASAFSKFFGAIFGSLFTAVTVPLLENPLTQIFNLMRSDITFDVMLKNILLWPFTPFLGLVHGGRIGSKKGLIEGFLAGGDAIPFFTNYKGNKERTTGVALGSALLFAAVTGIVLGIVLTAYFDPTAFISFMSGAVKFVQYWFGETIATFIAGLNYIGLAAIAGGATLFTGSLLMLGGIYSVNMGERDLKESWNLTGLSKKPPAANQYKLHDISDFSESFGHVFCGTEPNDKQNEEKDEERVVSVVENEPVVPKFKMIRP